MHMTQRLTLCASLFLMLLTAPCQGEDLSAEQLARVHLQRVHLYCGWEFEYESFLATGGGEPLKLKNTLVLDVSDERVYRLWIANREKTDDPQLDDSLLLHRFAGWNGKQYREYEGKNLPGVPRDRGSIFASERASYAYNENRFDAILTSGPHGIPQYVDASGEVFEKHPFRFRVVGGGKRLGVSTLKLEAKSGAELLAEVELSDTPERLLLRQVIYNNNQPVLQSDVTSLDRFDGTLYPKSGRLKQQEVGGIRALDYRFEVEKVSKTDRSSDDWFPQWPAETVVIDHTNGAKQSVIPSN
jgi:hypothetical protein